VLLSAADPVRRQPTAPAASLREQKFRAPPRIVINLRTMSAGFLDWTMCRTRTIMIGGFQNALKRLRLHNYIRFLEIFVARRVNQTGNGFAKFYRRT